MESRPTDEEVAAFLKHFKGYLRVTKKTLEKGSAVYEAHEALLWADRTSSWAPAPTSLIRVSALIIQEWVSRDGPKDSNHFQPYTLKGKQVGS